VNQSGCITSSSHYFIKGRAQHNPASPSSSRANVHMHCFLSPTLCGVRWSHGHRHIHIFAAEFREDGTVCHTCQLIITPKSHLISLECIRLTCCPLFHSLKTFFNKTRDMMYFKRLIQIPKLPDVRAQRVRGRLDDFSHRPSWISMTSR